MGDLEKTRNVETVAIHIPGVLNDLPDQLSRGIPWGIAQTWSFNKELFPEFIVSGIHLCGLQWERNKVDSSTFDRMQQLEGNPQKLLVAVSTPDIPLIANQLQQLRNSIDELFILVPKLPSSDLLLSHTRIVSTNSVICCNNAPNIEWWLLEVMQSGGTPAKIAKNS